MCLFFLIESFFPKGAVILSMPAQFGNTRTYDPGNIFLQIRDSDHGIAGRRSSGFCSSVSMSFNHSSPCSSPSARCSFHCHQFPFPIHAHITLLILPVAHHVPGIQFMRAERILSAPDIAGNDIGIRQMPGHQGK